MPNINNNAYGLTTLCPILNGTPRGSQRSHASLLREKLDELPLHENSPMAAVPETYLCRLFVLNDVIYEGVDEHKFITLPLPAKQDLLKSRYLVFTSNFHGTSLANYLRGMWDNAEGMIRDIWQHCISFNDSVFNGSSFAAYIERCQVETTFYFNGSNDLSLAEQLKGLYLKQELSNFAFEHQNASAKELKEAFDAFIKRTCPGSLAGPTWRPGASELSVATVDHRSAAQPLDARSDVSSLRGDGLGRRRAS